jgi:putative sterol carrier protein
MDFIDDLVLKLSEAIKARPAPRNSLKIKVKGLGVIVATQSLITREEIPADNEIALSRADCEKLVAGKLNPQMAYLQGKIKITGDPAMVLQWLPILLGK